MTSRDTSSRLGLSSMDSVWTPVRFPPGRTRLWTRPSSNGFPVAVTMGIVAVAWRAAWAADEPDVTMTSTLSRTSSLASAGSRGPSPSALRASKATVWPSTYPSSRIAWRNTFHSGARGARVPDSSSPMRGTFPGWAWAASGAASRARMTLTTSARRDAVMCSSGPRVGRPSIAPVLTARQADFAGRAGRLPTPDEPV